MTKECTPRPRPFQREITLLNLSGRVSARVQDNVHDFEITLDHDGSRVTGIAATAHRVPWTTCPLATNELGVMIGAPLRDTASWIVDQTGQCTHMLDLTKLAIAQATRTGDRVYSIDIRPADVADASHAILRRDGSVLLDWRIASHRVVEGAGFVGHVTTGRAEWPAGIPENTDLVEAGLILRRCLLVFHGRGPAGQERRASDLPYLRGVCFTFQPSRSFVAVRPHDFRDYPSWAAADGG